ncbi:hypothetical protein HOU70_gp30 [Arthrobacter phage Liebe]|uniref:Uncharacterized protein n=2 Tax=Arthrobacter virus Liebe TaxID=2734245 RepID=A0A3G2KHT1_9CAUD|nr:hypothetical protein HOU70_gp30 [Arthrobacter phage Liebe]AYN58511.1 hypothetical protein PBI_MAUREEN_30 [Arthrobacter phage Maureen]AZF93763.1 hypothetical protein PBI_LIEBE_30 [Arthrobacter phage Liebe]
MTAREPLTEAPDFVLDHLGREVRVGDRIAYAVLAGRSASLSTATVLGIQLSNPAYGDPQVKLKVQGRIRRYDGEMVDKAPGLLYASYRRFVKLD